MRYLLLLAALIAGPASLADDKPIEGDLAKLQGSWSGKTGRNGVFTTVWTIKGDQVQFDNVTESGKKTTGGTGILALDGQGKPHKTIDSTIVKRQGGIGGGPGIVLGIYEFVDADTIRICNGSPTRPAAFGEDVDGEFRMTFTLKRVTGPKESK